jgi:hypothetical protein
MKATRTGPTAIMIPDGHGAGHKSGCLVCGEPLVYADHEREVPCFYCGAAGHTSVACTAGHFVCDACHSGSANDLIERFCSAANSSLPLSMAITLMRDRRLKMHGPEHHFLVPAVLLAAYCNTKGTPREEKAALIKKARSRAEEVKGGSCGFNGNCGAGVGTGIFVSLATGATPLSRGEWRLANLMTSDSLRAIAEHGGPRCCKRDVFLALRTAVAFLKEELHVALPAEEQVTCEFSPLNRECLKEECPFYIGALNPLDTSAP